MITCSCSHAFEVAHFLLWSGRFSRVLYLLWMTSENPGADGDVRRDTDSVTPAGLRYRVSGAVFYTPLPGVVPWVCVRTSPPSGLFLLPPWSLDRGFQGQ